MRQHQVNAMAVARFLEKNPRVEKVVYPGKICGQGGLIWLHNMGLGVGGEGWQDDYLWDGGKEMLARLHGLEYGVEDEVGKTNEL